MFKYLLEGTETGWMAIFALVTFFALFAIILFITLRANPKHIDHMANLPLEDDEPVSFPNQTSA